MLLASELHCSRLFYKSCKIGLASYLFLKNENEHEATSGESIKIMLRTCPSHGVNE
jgi:hypothetical protein